uniref:Sema domain, immunoglobulin domain (Ig), short basic domain, secreted, (semaphorin) 3B n=1 Tax=Eptatretus burgeri TaxID=7764 RepID=A0A8C4QQ34_EPTBU
SCCKDNPGSLAVHTGLWTICVVASTDIHISSPELTDLLLSKSSMVFRGNTSEHGVLLMDEERGRLFVGGRDTLFSLSLTDINNRPLSNECWNFIRLLQPLNNTHLYACGTGAFHPVCAAMHVGPRAGQSGESGRGKSPYDPKQQTTSVIVDELYAGVASDFMGRDFAIFRTLGVRPAIRTEQHNSRWLNEPKFVAAYAIPESNSRDEDKVYFFFRETALEGEYIGKTVFSRVSQICQNDVGGHRSMINRWTTFLKARLVCSVPGSNGIDTYFDELQDVFLLQTRDPKNPVIYTIFSTSSNVFQGSAVCVYTMSDIRRVFLGPFAHKDGPNHKWTAYQGKVPYPRPGTVSRIVSTFGKLMFVMCRPIYNIIIIIILFLPWCCHFLDLSTRTMGTEMDNVEERLLYGVGNSTLLLECVPRSLQAHVAWMFSQPNDENREEVKTDDRVVVTPQGLLLRSVVRNDAGLYACRTTEHSFVQTLARFRLEVIGPEQLDILLRQRRGDLAILDKDSSSPRVWYREFLRLVNHPSLSGGVAEICERARLSKKQRPHRRRKARGRGAQKLGRGNLLKWKHAHEARKRRNRRTHNGNTRPPRSIDA